MKRICIMLGIFCSLCIATQVHSQYPFSGVAVQEVAIPYPQRANIADEMGLDTLGGDGLPRTWQIFACMEDPFWELQAYTGYAGLPWTMTCNSCDWYNHGFGTFTSASFNSALISFFPELAYDSYFTIGPGFGNSDILYVASTVNDIEPIFESGQDFNSNDVDGNTIGGFWFPPNPQGQPDADNKVLIAQITTDGIFDAVFNFQFRELDPVTLIPTAGPVISLAAGVSITNTPGVIPDLCPVLFLPIELLNFNAKEKMDHVELDWSTASETNNETFVIQKSVDRETWDYVTSVPGAGNSNTMNLYTSYDWSPTQGISYYRLKQIDFNGDVSYSQEIPVVFKGQDFTVSPNPASTNVRVQGDFENYVWWNLTNSQGQIVFEFNSSDQSYFDLDVSDFNSGVYHIHALRKDGTLDSKKVVITNR